MVKNVAADGELYSGGVKFGLNGKVRSALFTHFYPYKVIELKYPYLAAANTCSAVNSKFEKVGEIRRSHLEI